MHGAPPWPLQDSLAFFPIDSLAEGFAGSLLPSPPSVLLSMYVVKFEGMAFTKHLSVTGDADVELC